MTPGPEHQVVLDADAIQRIVRRIALAIVEQTRGAKSVAVVGIRRGGVELAKRIAEVISTEESHEVPTGTIDIALYRDDAATALPDPKIGPSEIPFDVRGMDIVLVDDVLMTGRTVRAAIDCLQDFGRPRRIWLAVLCDRGGRELPIAADFVGRVIEVPRGLHLNVHIEEAGQEDRASLIPRAPDPSADPTAPGAEGETP